MSIPNIKPMETIFRGSTFNDNQGGIFRGRRRPSDPSDIDKETTWNLTEDFNADTIDTSQWGSSAAGNSTITITDGVLKIFTTDDNDTAYFYGIKKYSLVTNTQITFIAKIKQTSHADADCQYVIGLDGSLATFANDAAEWLSLTTDTNPDSVFKWTTKDGTATQTAGTLVSGTWYELKIVLTAAKAEYWKNGILVHTNVVNIPDDIGLFPYFRVKNSDAANNDYQLEIDSVRIKVI